MVRISRHVTVNIKLLAKSGELGTKLSVSLVQHTFFESQIQKWERAAGLDRGHFDGRYSNHSTDAATRGLRFSANPALQKTVINVPEETLESTL